MKKIFTLLAVAAMAMSANADTLYSWSSVCTGSHVENVDGADKTIYDSKVTEVGGTATGIGDASRVNYANTDPRVGHEGEVFFTICLSGKNDFGTSVQIALDNELAAGDKIELTGYKNKDATDKAVTVIFKYGKADDAAATTWKEADDAYWANINPAGEADTELTTREFEVPAEAAGVKYLSMSRSKSGTNLFLTNVVVYRGAKSDNSALNTIAADNNAPVEYFNLQGIRVNNPENGLFIRRQGNNVTKVIL